MRALLTGLVGLLLACASACGARAQLKSAPGAPVTIPFELIDNRVFIEVTINGHGPFHFILDTGAVGAISEATAQILGLKVQNQGEEGGVGESRVRAGQTDLASLQIGKLEFRELSVGVLPLTDSNQVFGTKPVDGIIGLPVFENLVVKHDYIHHTLTFTDPAQFKYAGQGTVVDFERPNQIPVIAAELDGVKGRFGVDTGARSSLLIYRPFAEQNHLQQKYAAHLEGVTGWGIGGPVRSLLARARSFTVGAIAIEAPVIRISTQRTGLTTSSALAGLIGPDILSQYDVTFDYRHQRIIFEKNPNYGRRDSYDRAGVWMGQSGNAFLVVDVIPGGPAGKAGLKSGDKITAIDGESTAKLLLPDVRERIRRTAPGTRLSLSVLRGSTELHLLITLADLV